MREFDPETDRIVTVTLDPSTIASTDPDEVHEWRIAIYDLVEDNTFAPARVKATGPFALHVSIIGNSIVLDVRHPETFEPIAAHYLSLTPFRRLIRDYFRIRDSYYEAIRSASPFQIETVDMARRGLHNEAAELLRTRLHNKLEMDLNTIGAAFVVVVVGGMGSLPGAYVAALLIAEIKALCIWLGVVDVFGLSVSFSKLTLVVDFLVMAVVLVWRPWGLMGRAQAPSRYVGMQEEPLRRASRGYVLAAAALAALLAVVPFLTANSPYTTVLMIDLLVAALVVVVDHGRMAGGLELLDRVRPDIPCTAGDEDVHVCSLVGATPASPADDHRPTRAMQASPLRKTYDKTHNWPNGRCFNFAAATPFSPPRRRSNDRSWRAIA